jgi:ABC-2 type transport system permease protein
MRALALLTWTELKLFLREPVGAFFTLVFPLILLFLFGTIFGNDPSAQLGGRGSIDVAVPGYIALIVGTVGLLGLPAILATYRDQGILRRYRATPLRPQTLLAAHVLVNLLMASLGVALLVAAGRLVFNLRLPEAAPAVALGFLIACLSFFALGFLIAGLLPTARVTQPVTMALFFPMMFLSGAAMPRQLFPETLARVSEALPLTQVVILVDTLWTRGTWPLVSVAILAGILVVSTAISARTFRWE